ncbi:hypothetical protein RUM43_012064 [Polyplax serrata]|uniref:Uncharacterized protein n=1 Tax=Polyplax serrata TaxID=468196 RepID=A0AAN8S9T6_POLSC
MATITRFYVTKTSPLNRSSPIATPNKTKTAVKKSKKDIEKDMKQKADIIQQLKSLANTEILERIESEADILDSVAHISNNLTGKYVKSIRGAVVLMRLAATVLVQRAEAMTNKEATLQPQIDKLKGDLRAQRAPVPKASAEESVQTQPLLNQE